MYAFILKITRNYTCSSHTTYMSAIARKFYIIFGGHVAYIQYTQPTHLEISKRKQLLVSLQNYMYQFVSFLISVNPKNIFYVYFVPYLKAMRLQTDTVSV